MKRLVYSVLSVLLCVSLFLPAKQSFAAGIVEEIVVSQAGYSQNDFKIAHAIADDALVDKSFQVKMDGNTVYTGTMEYEGITWGQHVYSIDFRS